MRVRRFRARAAGGSAALAVLVGLFVALPASPAHAVAAASASDTAASGDAMALQIVQNDDAQSLGQDSTQANLLCWGQPYPVNYSGGHATGEARTFCNQNAYSLQVAADLQRGRWYGWENLDSDSDTQYGVSSVEVYLQYYCGGDGTFTYRTFSEHWANVGLADEQYRRIIGPEHRFAC